MAVDNCFDFFRVDLETADVDHAVSSTNKVISVSAQLDHVAGVDEAVVGRQGLGKAPEVSSRVSSRADPKRAVLDFQLGVSTWTADERRRKACESIADLEADSGLGRSEGMNDSGVPIESSQAVQYYLVRYLSRQADVPGCDLVGRRTHQHTTPMGRSPRDMRNTTRSRPGQEVRGRFLGVREHKRCSVEKRAQKNLQAAVAAYVVKGAPNNGFSQLPIALDGSFQAGDSVQGHFRLASGARSKEDPFRLVALTSIGIGADQAGTAGYGTSYAWNAGVSRRPGLIGHDGIHTRGRGDERKTLAREIARTKNEPARDAIEFDKRQAGTQLIPRRD